jgi:hypothetical protein
MSWGSQEGDWISQFESQFNSPTDSFFASTGDDGFAGGVSYPASSQYVVAVGGKEINTDKREIKNGKMMKEIKERKDSSSPNNSLTLLFCLNRR